MTIFDLLLVWSIDLLEKVEQNQPKGVGGVPFGDGGAFFLQWGGLCANEDLVACHLPELHLRPLCGIIGSCHLNCIRSVGVDPICLTWPTFRRLCAYGPTTRGVPAPSQKPRLKWGGKLSLISWSWPLPVGEVRLKLNGYTACTGQRATNKFHLKKTIMCSCISDMISCYLMKWSGLTSTGKFRVCC